MTLSLECLRPRNYIRKGDGSEHGPIHVTRHGEAVFLDGGWSEEMLISDAFLAVADPRYVASTPEIVTFTLGNGHASYRLADRKDGWLSRWRLIAGTCLEPD